jgi:hypothetical protein
MEREDTHFPRLDQDQSAALSRREFWKLLGGGTLDKEKSALQDRNGAPAVEGFRQGWQGQDPRERLPGGGKVALGTPPKDVTDD